MPTLQDLPPELQIHILTCIPTLQSLPSRSDEHLNPGSPLTPLICRVSHFLRREALALYVKNHSFSFPPSNQRGEGFGTWLDVMDGAGILEKIWRGMMLSEDWKVERPERGERHVGFYVRIDFGSGSGGGHMADEGKGRQVQVKTGTSPVVNDPRGMRFESVNLLRDIIVTYLRQRGDPAKGLGRQDVEFVVQAMGVVARHPIAAFDLEQSEHGRQARRRVWEAMERELKGLLGEGEDDETSERGRREGNGVVTGSGSVFFTPY